MADNRAEYAEILKSILTDGISLTNIKNTIADKDRGFANMLLMTTLRQLTFIKTEVLPKFVKKENPAKAKHFGISALFGGCRGFIYEHT